ncbi:hypothetical protein AQ436_06470 [Arthrobacter sp. EpRS66]|nr:hypothetical protein AQ436_06470 [Arthrobacter sp. EpRS66]
MSVYLTPEQAVEVFGRDELQRPFVTKHEIRRHAKESGIYSTVSRGKLVFTQEQIQNLKTYIVDKQAHKIDPKTGTVDNFA